MIRVKVSCSGCLFLFSIEGGGREDTRTTFGYYDGNWIVLLSHFSKVFPCVSSTFYYFSFFPENCSGCFLPSVMLASGTTDPGRIGGSICSLNTLDRQILTNQHATIAPEPLIEQPKDQRNTITTYIYIYIFNNRTFSRALFLSDALSRWQNKS